MEMKAIMTCVLLIGFFLVFVGMTMDERRSMAAGGGGFLVGFLGFTMIIAWFGWIFYRITIFFWNSVL